MKFKQQVKKLIEEGFTIQIEDLDGVCFSECYCVFYLGRPVNIDNVGNVISIENIK